MDTLLARAFPLAAEDPRADFFQAVTIIGAVFLSLGILIAILGTWSILRVFRIRSRWIFCQGIIIEDRTDYSGSYGPNTCSYIVAYNNAAGREYRSLLHVREGNLRRDGNKVAVRYRPDAPEHAVFDPPSQEFKIIAVSFFGFAFSFVGVVTLIVSRAIR
jgi:hypothetical protein